MDLPTSVVGLASTVVVLLLGLGAMGRGLWKMLRKLVRVHDLIEKELSNNGGSSMKDQIESANRYAQQATEAAEAARVLAAEAKQTGEDNAAKLTSIERQTIEASALALSHERELGSVNTRIKQLENSDEGNP